VANRRFHDRYEARIAQQLRDQDALDKACAIFDSLPYNSNDAWKKAGTKEEADRLFHEQYPKIVPMKHTQRAELSDEALIEYHLQVMLNGRARGQFYMCHGRFSHRAQSIPFKPTHKAR
jgi:hypothetical protein